MIQLIRCPDCGGDIVVEIDDGEQEGLDYVHVTPACPMFARRSYDENVRRMKAAWQQD
jgi:hypothetical protein